MSITKNYVYNLMYQVFSLLIPLATIPYISRVVGSNGVGINAFTSSIVQYFVLFGTIGISLYGNRAIAYVRDDKNELSRVFWGIFVLKVITTSFSLFFYLFYLQFTNTYHEIFMIQSIAIISAAIDVSWLYMGLEDFKKTVVRSLIVRLIGVACIFLFVRTPDDLEIYVFILTFSQMAGNLSLWAYLPKTINRVKIKFGDIRKHLKPSLSLFIPQIAIQIYIVLNKTMLGLFSNTNEVGYFDNADKVVKIVLSIVTAIGIVMLPRVSNTYAKGQIEQVREYINKSFNFSSYLSVPLMFGLAGISMEFAPWFFGSEFEKSGLLICFLSPIIVFIAWSNVIGQQYLMPIGNTKAFTTSVVIGAVVNLIFNFLLIGRYHSVGAAAATLIAEVSVTVFQLYCIRRDLQLTKLFSSIWKYIVAGMLMFGITRFIGITLGVGIQTTIIQVISGAVVYFVLLYFMKSELNSQLCGKGFQYIRKILINSSSKG